MSRKKKAFENTVEKVENAGNQHFLLLPQCFSLYKKREITILTTLNLLSANAFNLIQSKILSVTQELMYLEWTVNGSLQKEKIS